METELVPKRRGRKRRRKDVQNGLVDGQATKKPAFDTNNQAVEPKLIALVGRYVKKEFDGSGVFLGKVVYYDTGLYRIDYEDGDCEDLESGEIRKILMMDEDFDHKFMLKKKKLDGRVSKKYAKGIPQRKEFESAIVDNAADRVEASSMSGVNGVDGVQQVEDESDSSSDSCETSCDQDMSSDAEAPLVPPPILPHSSGNISVPEEYVSHLLSVYSFLRSFSIGLYLSPFGLDEFVGSLNCSVPNTLLDAIHVALMRALRRHLETLSPDVSELASKCLRCMDWSLLDTLTWPVYVVQYLIIMGYTEGLEWKGFYIDALEKDYYTLSAGRKLMILQILCDDALDSAELRADIEMRVESEMGTDLDGVPISAPQSGPRRVHPRYSKTSACKDQETIDVMAEREGAKASFDSVSSGFKSCGPDIGDDIDNDDGNGDECRLCGMDGTLLCCDGCPSAYHLRCIGVSKMSIPDGAWYCPECTINKIGPTISRGTSLRGAEVFGIDSYEQVFLGTCNHLLVLKVSTNCEPCVRYYNQNDISNVLQTLYSSPQHIAMYSEICKGISQYWEIPEDLLLSLSQTVEMGAEFANKKEGFECSTPSIDKCENFASTESTSENVAVSSLENNCIEPGNSEACPSQIKQELTISAGSVSLQADPTDIKHAICTSGNSNTSYRVHSNGTLSFISNLANQRKESISHAGGDFLYLGSSYKSQAYFNNYTHGDFAASASANLAIVSSEENRVTETHASSNHTRKVMSANVLLQVRAFSLAAARFFWPNSEKKHVEVPRERCGWCLSCKAPVTSKKGCLLNAAASNAIKGPMKILAGLRPVKNGEESLPSIATYVMFMEESLCGLTLGQFLSLDFRKQWRKQMEQASTCSDVKTLLLQLEQYIHIIALSGDWVKLVDNWAAEASANQSGTNVNGSTQKRGPGRRGRKKKAPTSDTTAADDSQDISAGFMWWRGGMLSKHIFQKGTLPLSLVKKAARQSGSRKIAGICYAEGFEIPRRNKQMVWRATVEMSKTASQLALQVRYLDHHVRWSDLVRPEQTFQDGKGPETEAASAFRNAFICDKRIGEKKTSYGIAFGNQKHLPTRVMKNVLEVEQCEDGKEKYWFSETYIPLYLIKEYEEEKVKRGISLSANTDNKPASVLSKLQRRQLKLSRKDIFLYLSKKRDNQHTCFCAACQLDVLIRNVVKCGECQGYCHEQCTISTPIGMNEEVEYSIICKECRKPKIKPIMQTENDNNKNNNKESPNSPLLLQRQEFHSAPPVTKSRKQNGSNNLPSAAYVGNTERCSSAIKPKAAAATTPDDSGSAASYRSKIRSWGLIWSKKGGDNTGIDFRIKNIMLKNNPNRVTEPPECHLCHKKYDSSLMYVRCESCKKWYHAEALELEEAKIFELAGFKCCKCRRIRSPVCPYLDPDDKIALESKKLQRRVPKKLNASTEPDSEIILGQHKGRPANSVLPLHDEVHLFSPSGVVNPVTVPKPEVDLELTNATGSVLGPQKPPVSRSHITNERETFVQENDHILFTHSGIEQATELKPESEVEWNNNSSLPQKLPVRRQTKRENELDGSSLADNPQIFDSSTPFLGEDGLLNPKDESSLSVEWDIPANGFDDNMMFDYEGLNYEDMEFEPQTYFSFTELLANDDTGQVDGVDQSVDVIASWDNTPPEEYGIGIPTEQQEPRNDKVGPGVDTVPCSLCSKVDPCPDLSCQICGSWIHSQCSPLDVEESLWEGGWRCINCREWR